MPDFLITADGKKFKVTAPDQETALAAFAERAGIKPQETAAPEAKGDNYVSQGLSGFNEGLGKTLGLPVDALTGIINAGMGGSNALLHTDFKPIEKPFLGSESINDMQRGVGTTTAESADPGKQMVRRIGQEFGASAIPSLGAASKVARPAMMLANEALLTAGAGGGAAIADQFSDNPWADLAGEILGMGTVAGAQRIARRAITPFPANASRTAAADALKKEGVNLTAGQRTGSKGLQYAESELGGAKIADLTENQAEQFTSAALAKAGVRAKRATPDVIDGAFTDIGKQFDSLASRNEIVADKQFGADLRNTLDEYKNLVPESARAPVIDSTIFDLATALQANKGILSGDAYKTLRSRLDRSQRGTLDPELKQALTGFRSALDDAMERTIAQANPGDLGAWQTVRNDYRNLLVIEKASTGAGEGAASGLISPAALRQATVSTHGRRSYARGQSDFSELAHAGQETMTPLPQSGTAPRTVVRNLGATVPTILGAAAGAPGGVLGSLAGAAAGAAVPHIIGKALTSQAGQRYLSNQLLRRAQPQAGQGVGAIVAALTAQMAKQSQLPAPP